MEKKSSSASERHNKKWDYEKIEKYKNKKMKFLPL
jgi:hypothetical protein